MLGSSPAAGRGRGGRLAARLAGRVAGRAAVLAAGLAIALRPVLPVLAAGGLAVAEAGPLGDERQQPRRSPPRLVDPGLPLAHGLLARAQLVRELLLGEPHVPAQRPHALRVPRLVACPLRCRPDDRFRPLGPLGPRRRIVLPAPAHPNHRAVLPKVHLYGTPCRSDRARSGLACSARSGWPPASSPRSPARRPRQPRRPARRPSPTGASSARSIWGRYGTWNG